MQRLGVPSYEHLTSVRKGTETELLIGSRSLRHLEPHVKTSALFSVRY